MLQLPLVLIVQHLDRLTLIAELEVGLPSRRKLHLCDELLTSLPENPLKVPFEHLNPFQKSFLYYRGDINDLSLQKVQKIQFFVRFRISIELRKEK